MPSAEHPGEKRRRSTERPTRRAPRMLQATRAEAVGGGVRRTGRHQWGAVGIGGGKAEWYRGGGEGGRWGLKTAQARAARRERAPGAASPPRLAPSPETAEEATAAAARAPPREQRQRAAHHKQSGEGKELDEGEACLPPARVVPLRAVRRLIQRHQRVQLTIARHGYSACRPGSGEGARSTSAPHRGGGCEHSSPRSWDREPAPARFRGSSVRFDIAAGTGAGVRQSVDESPKSRESGIKHLRLHVLC